MATGPFSDDDLGVACYHSKTGAVELYLNHLLDGPGEYVVVTARPAPSRSPPACSPGSTYRSWSPSRPEGHRRLPAVERVRGRLHVALAVVGNKVQDEQDVAFLREHAGEDLLTCSARNPGYEPWNKAARSAWPTSAPGQRRARHLQDAVDAQAKDWDTFTRQAAEFHLQERPGLGEQGGGATWPSGGPCLHPERLGGLEAARG